MRPFANVPSTPAAVLGALRLILLATFVVGVVGVIAELLLIEHYEEIWQLSPLLLLLAALLALGWYGLRRSPAALRAFRVVMLLFVASGFVGVLLHYKGNTEFELERDPAIGGLALFWESVRGATPALAPGTMIQLALVGLAYTFRHPALAGGARRVA
jgi:hypothetical protein